MNNMYETTGRNWDLHNLVAFPESAKAPKFPAEDVRDTGGVPDYARLRDEEMEMNLAMLHHDDPNTITISRKEYDDLLKVGENALKVDEYFKAIRAKVEEMFTIMGRMNENYNNMANKLKDAQEQIKRQTRELSHYRGFVPSHPWLAYGGDNFSEKPAMPSVLEITDNGVGQVWITPEGNRLDASGIEWFDTHDVIVEQERGQDVSE